MNAKLAFISAHSSSYTIRRLCAVLRVARAGSMAGVPGLPSGRRDSVPRPRSSSRSEACSRTAARAMAPRAFMPTCEPEAFTAAASGWPGS